VELEKFVMEKMKAPTPPRRRTLLTLVSLTFGRKLNKNSKRAELTNSQFNIKDIGHIESYDPFGRATPVLTTSVVGSRGAEPERLNTKRHLE